jgi:hypothetical protein
MCFLGIELKVHSIHASRRKLELIFFPSLYCNGRAILNFSEEINDCLYLLEADPPYLARVR